MVVGLGNEYAGDDAVGILAARALRREIGEVTDIVESAASGLALLEVFAGYDRAVVIDSIRTGTNPPGTILELGFTDVGQVVAPSLHQAGIPELAAVAGRFGLQFPAETSVLAVEVADPPTFGAPMSEPVATAVALAGSPSPRPGRMLRVRARSAGRKRYSVMHDYFAVRALIARLENELGSTENVVEVRVKASPVYSQEALKQAYEMLTAETFLSGSRLVVEELPYRLQCTTCKICWTASYEDVVGHLVACPSCGSLSPFVGGAGMELVEIRRAEPITTVQS